MNIATLIRFRGGSFDSIWANNSWYAHGQLIEIARRHGIGMTVIAAESSYGDVDKLCAGCDGLIVPGDILNVDPVYYGGAPLDPPNPVDNYALDSRVIAAFDKAGKPMLGICGGHQALNVFYGGTLGEVSALRDTSTPEHGESNTVADRFGNKIEYKTHWVTVEKDSFMYDAYGSERALVNTYHEQTVGRLADGFRIVAWADDGIVEAIECKEKKVFATQFHPELGLRMNNPKDLAIFENFFRLCEENRK